MHLSECTKVRAEIMEELLFDQQQYIRLTSTVHFCYISVLVQIKQQVSYRAALYLYVSPKNDRVY